MTKPTPIITDFSGLTINEMLEVVKAAEEKRQLQCKASSISYLRRRAREAGLSIEEYTQTLDPRGCRRKYFPPGIAAPARRPPRGSKKSGDE